MEDAAKYGMTIVIDEKLPRDLSDMTSILTKVKLVKPDVLIVSGHTKGAATAVRQIGEQSVSVPMIAITHCEAADVTGNFGDFAENVLCSTQWAETLSYEDPIFGSAANYEVEFKVAYPEYSAKKVPIRRPRPRLRSMSSRTHSNARDRWTRKPCATQSLRPISAHSMATSGSRDAGNNVPSRWFCARFRVVCTRWLPRRPSPRTRWLATSVASG